MSEREREKREKVAAEILSLATVNVPHRTGSLTTLFTLGEPLDKPPENLIFRRSPTPEKITSLFSISTGIHECQRVLILCETFLSLDSSSFLSRKSFME